MLTVNGPSDVKPGDLVEYTAYDAWQSTTPVICTVVRAGKSSLTVKRADGGEFRAGYVKSYTSKVFRFRERCTHHNFSRLDARDRWMRDLPVTPLSINASTRDGLRSIVLMPADVRCLATTIGHLEAVQAWMAREPDRDAP